MDGCETCESIREQTALAAAAVAAERARAAWPG
jgi:hypothetical protein